jgi:hypothetical protein
MDVKNYTEKFGGFTQKIYIDGELVYEAKLKDCGSPIRSKGTYPTKFSGWKYTFYDDEQTGAPLQSLDGNTYPYIGDRCPGSIHGKGKHRGQAKNG